MPTFQFFSTRRELLLQVSFVREKLQLACYSADVKDVLQRRSKVPDSCCTIYLAAGKATVSTVSDIFKHGGVQLKLGAESVDTVGLSELATTSAAHRMLYKRLRASFVKDMDFGVYGKNTVSGAVSFYPDIGITKGALLAHRSGATLIQRHVSNVIFLAPSDVGKPPTSPVTR